MDINSKSQQNVKDNTFENDDVNTAIRKIVENKGYVRHNVYKKVHSPEGGNYLGVLYEIDIKGETAVGKKEEINIFLKQMIPNGNNIKILSISEIYSREIFIYSELAKVFKEVQDKANISMKKRFKLVKMYEETKINVIILENLTKQGFKVNNRLDVMKLDYGKLCIEQLAKFHGLSFVIERTMPEYFENKIKSLKQPLTIDDNCKATMNHFYDLATKKISSDLKIKTDKWWETALGDYSKYLQGKMTKIKCLCHGDYKMNNIMYKETNGQTTEVIAVDYQLAHYGSPILDLSYFIYLGTDEKFRRQHKDYLKDHYYNSLKEYLEYFDVFAKDVYPREMFEKDFVNSVDYALICCIWILSLNMISQDQTIDISDSETFHLGLKLHDRYYDRIEGLFEDCI